MRKPVLLRQALRLIEEADYRSDLVKNMFHKRRQKDDIVNLQVS